jgi:hypothetical protein
MKPQRGTKTETQIEQLKRKLAADPQFQEAKKTGHAYIIVGARNPVTKAK